MIYLVGLMSLACFGYILCFIADEEIGIPVGILGTVLTVGLGIALVANAVSATGAIAEIEALRTEVVRLGADARTEDILGKVADVNMQLASCRQMNTVPTLDWFYIDALCNTPPIEIVR